MHPQSGTILSRVGNTSARSKRYRRPFHDLVTLSTDHFQQAGIDLSWYDHSTSYGLDYNTRTVGRFIYSSHLSAISSMSASNGRPPHPESLDNGLSFRGNHRRVHYVLSSELWLTLRDHLLEIATRFDRVWVPPP